MNGLWLPLMTTVVAVLALLAGSNGFRHHQGSEDDDGPRYRDRRPQPRPQFGPLGPFGQPEGPFGHPGHFDGPHRPNNNNYDENCRNFTWFVTTNATSGDTCLTELPKANNVTTPFYNNQTLLKEGNFTICVCCLENPRRRMFSCRFRKGSAELRAVNVTTVE